MILNCLWGATRMISNAPIAMIMTSLEGSPPLLHTGQKKAVEGLRAAAAPLQTAAAAVHENRDFQYFMFKFNLHYLSFCYY